MVLSTDPGNVTDTQEFCLLIRQGATDLRYKDVMWYHFINVTSNMVVLGYSFPIDDFDKGKHRLEGTKRAAKYYGCLLQQCV
jgi:hypothetical protein